MDNPASGGAGGGGGDGSLTSSFPDGREPERRPEAVQAFEAASHTDEQTRQDQDRIDALEAQRSKPEVQGMNYTIGGTIEQEVHEQVDQEREAEIKSLRERVARHRARGRGR